MEKSKEEIIEEMQQVTNQMVIDDLEENPDLANEFLIVIAAVKINVLQVLYSMKITDFVMIVYCWQRQVLPLENLLIFKI